MASPTVTYTFTNGTTADASAVNQNFSDLIAAMTDGSKSFSIDALTCAGVATLNGNIVLGNATGDTVTVNGVFAGTGGYYGASVPGILPVALSDLDNAAATRLGRKPYLHGTAYNGGNAPTITASTYITNIGNIRRGVFIPYLMQDGAWRLKINIVIDGMTTTSQTVHFINVNGVTFKNATSYAQALAGGTDVPFIQCVVAANSGAILMAHSSNQAPTTFYISGDVELESKPTWAY